MWQRNNTECNNDQDSCYRDHQC